MDFTQEDAGRKYALLHPTVQENAILKEAADKAGFASALKFDKEEKGYRLYEDAIPAGSMKDVDSAVGRFATDEARVASREEQAQFAVNKESAAKTVGADIDESKLYYPAVGNGDREEFNQMKKDLGATINYNSRAGAFVHKDGPTEGLEKFQTADAKAAWTAEYEEMKKTADQRRSKAADGVDTIAARAEGRAFLADNAKGFMLPSKTEAKVRDSQVAAMKGASNEEVTQVYRITETEKKNLDKKLYGVQINAARKLDDNFDEKAFNAMDSDARRKASNYASISKPDFAKLVAVRAGFFELRSEMQDRGLLNTVDKAREASASKAKEAGGGKAASGVKDVKAEKKAPAKKKSGMAAQLMQDAGMGR